jgi:hypothetical protein
MGLARNNFDKPRLNYRFLPPVLPSAETKACCQWVSGLALRALELDVFVAMVITVYMYITKVVFNVSILNVACTPACQNCIICVGYFLLQLVHLFIYIKF